MKRPVMAIAVFSLLGMAALSSGRFESTGKLTLRLIDADGGQVTSGVFRILDVDGKPISLTTDADGRTLLSRGLGLNNQPAIREWTVFSNTVALKLPRQPCIVEAFAGLDTELARRSVSLADGDAEVVLPLTRFYRAAHRGFRSANTHLHLMKLSREDADRYLTDVPRADRLDGLFVSYLERAEADRDYISNRYTREDLDRFAAATGIEFGNGEEHRHNFTAQGQGYGHVMLLDIPRLVQPVSIGPGITRTGTDGLPLARGIEQARRDAATVIWCHNHWGLERLANLVAGRLDAQNIFDGGTHGSYKDSFYRCLNAGINVPFSTGTDWFLYDFSRTYVEVDGPLTVKSWLKSLAAGRSYITNGPFLEFAIGGREPGERVALDKPGAVAVSARAIGRVDFERIELVQNGRVVRSQASRPQAGHFVAEMNFELSIEGPCWLALRIPPPPVKDDPELTETVPINEYGQPLFAHTSAIHVAVAGRRYFDRSVAEGLLAEMRENVGIVQREAAFADDAERARVLDVHHDAVAAMERRLAEAH